MEDKINLTVGDLIKSLSKYDPDLAIISLEGNYAPGEQAELLREGGHVKGEVLLLRIHRARKLYYLDVELPPIIRRDCSKLLVLDAKPKKD